MICCLWHFSRCLYEKAVFLKNTCVFFAFYVFLLYKLFLFVEKLSVFFAIDLSPKQSCSSLNSSNLRVKAYLMKNDSNK